MGGKTREALMIDMHHRRKYGNHSSSSLTRKDRASVLSEKKRQNSQNHHRSFWSRYRRSSETSSDDGSDSLTPYKAYHHPSSTSKDGQQQWWEDVVVADEASIQTSSGSNSNPSIEEGPSDEESRPSNLFRRNSRRCQTRNSHSSQTRVPKRSPLRVVTLPIHRSSSSKSSNDVYLLGSKATTTQSNSPTSSYKGKSGVVLSPQQRAKAREERRRELIAHYLYAESVAQAQTSNIPKHSSYHRDYFATGDDGDDGIVDRPFMDDSEADGVARRRSCFPSFGRPKFFPSKSESQDTSTGPQDDEEEAYDYDYYFTIGETNTRNNHGTEKELTHTGTGRGTENNPMYQRAMQCTKHYPSDSQLLRPSSRASHSTDSSRVAVRPAVCRFDHPDSYCFFPVDDHSNDGDGYDEEDYQNGDLPLCNWNDIRFYSSACAHQLASLEVTRELQSHCHENSQNFRKHYLEMTESTSKECAEISPRDALEDLVPQELLSLLLDSCHVEGQPSTKDTDTSTGNKTTSRSRSKSKRQDQVVGDKEWTARTTDATTPDEFHY